MVRKAKGNASTRLDVLEQQAEQARAAQSVPAGSDFDGGILGTPTHRAFHCLPFVDAQIISQLKWATDDVCNEAIEAASEHLPRLFVPAEVNDWLKQAQENSPRDCPVPPAGTVEALRKVADGCNTVLASENALSRPAVTGLKWYAALVRYWEFVARLATGEALAEPDRPRRMPTCTASMAMLLWKHLPADGEDQPRRIIWEEGWDQRLLDGYEVVRHRHPPDVSFAVLALDAYRHAWKGGRA